MEKLMAKIGFHKALMPKSVEMSRFALDVDLDFGYESRLRSAAEKPDEEPKAEKKAEKRGRRQEQLSTRRVREGGSPRLPLLDRVEPRSEVVNSSEPRSEGVELLDRGPS
ncbi:uncharacterized protein A4U43_C09F16610 [Asparagus officinalis]|uniref:Uncharacterized protein n=1 Tax=Asparagus officinalis TaxID=4686 RepID=A0A5P1E887_ASPOF|nr:uncharacterized protein A4U43_C09F16610 [Asparagus officinalis]